MNKLTGYFGDKPFYKKLIHLSVPIAFESLMLAAVAAADALMLGNVEQNAMSAVSLATQIQFIQNWIITSITAGTNILGAQYWGKHDRKSMDDIFAISLRLAGLASLICFIGCMFFPRYLMLLFTNEMVLVDIGVSYLKIAGWSYLLTGIVGCYLAVMRVSDHASPSAYISSATVVLNIILNAILIFGWFGLPAMGVRGAAVATLIARAVELLACVVISMRKDFIGFPAHRILRFNKLLTRDFLKASMPILGASIFWGVGFASSTALMAHMGTGEGQALRRLDDAHFLCDRCVVHTHHAGSDAADHVFCQADGGGTFLPPWNDDHHGGLYDRPCSQYRYHQRHFCSRRRYQF